MSTTTDNFSFEGKSVWVAGHHGMVGSALVRKLKSENCNILVVERKEVDLRVQSQVNDWMKVHKPDAVFLAAAKVGGISANHEQPADFLYDNLVIATNVIEASFRNNVEKLLFLGSSCIYPRQSEQPIREESLLTGALEPTNQWYAIAKIAGLKMCEAYSRQHGANFISAMPTNLYGEGDNFDLQKSHVLPAMLRKIDDARKSGNDSVVMWGTGSPRREFLHVDDLANALVFLMKNYKNQQTINVGSGDEVTISELGQLIANVVGYKGKFVHDTTKPDGTPRKLLDSSRLHEMGWRPQISLNEGIKRTYDWYVKMSNKQESGIRR